MPKEINLVVNSKLFDFLDQNKKVIAIYGGAGAGKSYAVAQNLALRFISMRNKHFLITRKTNPALRISAYALILQMLNEWGIPYHHNKSEQIIKFGNNVMIFKSLDDKEKIKSAEFNYAWMEEATEFDYEDYLQIRLRLRRATGKGLNQLFLTFNPVMVPWIEKELPNMASLHVTYKDNAFLSEDYIKMLEDLKNRDEAYYQIYTLGQFARVEGLIYRRWEPFDSTSFDWEGSWFGLDFGYNNPTAMVEIKIINETIYVRERIYKTHMTNGELIDLLKNMDISAHQRIYCDSAEPNRIRELQIAGFNAIKADKNVRNGIDYIKRFNMLVEGPNLIDELKTYKWREYKGEKLDEPVKFNDHLMDAMRYAVYTPAVETGEAASARVVI